MRTPAFAEQKYGRFVRVAAACGHPSILADSLADFDMIKQMIRHTQTEVVLGIVTHNGSVLMIERQDKEVGKGKEVLSWVFPGGKIENRETIFEAVAREVSEETGYRVLAEELIDECDHPTFPVRVSYIACRLDESTSHIKVLDSAVARVEWVKIRDVKSRVTSSLNDKVYEFLLRNG